MGNNCPELSICIPTDGVIQWVIPVLDSIYNQNVDENLFEVVITDNGNNIEFQNLIVEYQKKVKNLRYYKTNAFEFLNEIESYKKANGVFIKFINHRTLLKPGALQYFLSFIERNEKDKPDVYFLNGVLRLKNQVNTYFTFDDYVRDLSYYSSWSTGMGFWKTDFERISNYESFNVLFPHTNILFDRTLKSKYIIDNTVLLDEIPVGKIPKGKYNLFNAFAVEYLNIIKELEKKESITSETFSKIKLENFKFISQLYFDFVFRHKKCSYDLSNIEQSVNVYYSYKKLKRSIFGVFFAKICNKIKKIFRRK